ISRGSCRTAPSASSSAPRFSDMLLSPLAFRLQVNRMTQEQPSGLLLTGSGIQHRVPRRTISKYPALQWTYLTVSAGLHVGCPAWIATWHRLQTTSLDSHEAKS